ncbi:uncharacterized protein F5147DRAFT_435635 [Suillus discolor]|uniref:Uncharacterized protein n=1 Tax=Suillus discolor TaxID=1912936 RepID=A0A9P7JNA0_9AGAM|nr:uncharacterized protein F5147DRAFT_435635 [Suillus discolor]KAG2091977.1 hypothetical protein F5147DRAFT_435635 [Suillus discolor]
MPAPVAVCVVAAIAGVAAVIAFHEFVFEPHIAPAIERWAENFLADRRARRRGPIPLQSTQGSGHGDPGPSGVDLKRRTPAGEEDSVELQGFNLDEWRNQVHRTTPGTGMRRRGGVIPDTDEGSISSTMDESFSSLTHTLLTPTHFISNVSSPFAEALSVSTRTPSCSHSGSTPRTNPAYSTLPISPVVRTPMRSHVPSSRSSLQHSSSSSHISVGMQGSGANARMHEDMSTNTSIMESLSERYPAPPTPPVMLSPPSSHTTFSSPSTDILSLGSNSRSGSPLDLTSPPVRISEVHLPPSASLSGAASALSPLMSEHEFIVFGEALDPDGVASRSGSAHLHNPFTDFDEEGSDSGSEGSWRRVSVAYRR